MQTIKYKDREYKLPFEVGLPEDPTTTERITNRLGGDSCILPAFAVAVYDVIIGSEMTHDWDLHRQGLDWFSKYFTKEYYVLLD